MSKPDLIFKEIQIRGYGNVKHRESHRMPKGWEFFLAKSESIWLRELYVDLRPVKFANGQEKAYALKELTLSDSTFFPPQWKDKSKTPLKLKQFVAG